MKLKQISRQEAMEYVVDLEDAMGRKLSEDETQTAMLDYSFLHQFDTAGIEEIVPDVSRHIERLRAEADGCEDVEKIKSIAGQAIRMLQLVCYRVTIILEAGEVEASRIVIPGHGGK